MKKIFTVIGFSILYLPLLLCAIKFVTALDCDIPLEGYTYSTPMPEFKWKSFWDGEFQAECTAWLNEKVRPRGVATKVYATLRYNLFNLGNRPIGYHHDVMEMGYIDAELVINGAQDFSDPANQDAMKDYINKLALLQGKLEKHGVALYVYITPSKADFHYDNVLNKYKRLSNESAVKPIDYFSRLISETNIPYLICRDKRGELEYPAFYTTGIHWSRTFEQEVSSEIVEDLATLTGKKYRKIILGDVNASATPYWRDADVYKLLNVFNRVDDQVYYEYTEIPESDLEPYDKLRILVQGTSFGQGIVRDVLAIYPDETIYFVNRNQSFDISRYLNDIDAVVIETTEAELTQYSYGFVDYVNAYLDMCIPQGGTR